MKLKTYHAFTMAEALAAVKRDLGADAVILHTRHFKRGGILGIGRRTIVEVTASPALPQKAARPAVAPHRTTPKAAHARKAYAKSVAHVEKAAAPVESTAVSLEADRQRTRQLAMAMHEAHHRNVSGESALAAPATTQVEPKAKMPRATAIPGESRRAEPARAAKRFLLADPNAAATVITTATAREQAALANELGAIKQMVSHVLKRQAHNGSHNAVSPLMPKALFEMYLKLIAQDISDELADQIISEVRSACHDNVDDADLLRQAVVRQLAEFIPVASEPFPANTSDGRPLTLALIGPTGVGKTTTLAKLAATFTLQHHKRVGLITADTFRIAAVDQLRTYADIMNLPLQVALTPGEMKRAVQQFQDRDVILIDTPGRSQRDRERLTELRRFISSAQPHEVQLVLSSTAGERVLLQEAEAFAPAGVHKVVLTKLDEAVSFGMLVNVMRKIGKQVSFVTTGQEVPADIEVANADRLAELVLGEVPIIRAEVAPTLS